MNLALENYDGVEDVEFTTVWAQGHTEAERTGNSTDNFIAWVNEMVNTSQDATPAIVAATNAFLATLSDTELDTVSFDWTDTDQKQRWSNFPDGAFEHDSLMWGDMSETQQDAWLQVMQATLSTEGYNRVLAEWNGDDTLTGGGGQVHFGTAYYYIAIMGTPSETEPWQWQFGGPHITINVTIVGCEIALTPSFISVEPIEYTDADGNTVQPLKDIESTAFELMDALDSTQQQTAVLGDTAIDVVLGPGQDGKTIQSEGLPASEMTADQQEIFLQLIGYYTGLTNDEDAAARIAEIEETLDETTFAWYGPTDGSPAYFRVTGPTLVIEYSPQPSRNSPQPYHAHGIYRDPTNDYGEAYVE